MPTRYQRQQAWSQLNQPWDIVIIGGGITGAGILREATRLGLKTLLVEQRDFAWGTSSRSSKLVHGGLRYIKQGRLGLMRDSVRERERLLSEGPGLVEPLSWVVINYRGDRPGRWTFRAALSIYDLLALQWSHWAYNPAELVMLAPHVTEDGLEGGLRYHEAETDDARLVLRVIQEAIDDGGVALNYVRAEQLLLDEHGQVTGVRLAPAFEEEANRLGAADVSARVVINATGAWADRLRQQVGAPSRIRPLRGSHLVFPAWRLPVAQAVSFLHPIDHRPVAIFPWEGVTVISTTDVDHSQSLDLEPAISGREVAYLMAAVDYEFPSLQITLEDIVSTFAGVRPVIGTGAIDPSKESRDHVVWEENGLLTVTGGKLTTFRLIALDALEAVHHRLPSLPEPSTNLRMLNHVDGALPEAAASLDEPARRRLLGRYGAHAAALVAAAQPGELAPIPGTAALWAELRWSARNEAVLHLDDLLLRRVRLGLLLHQGGRSLMPRIREICQPELGWDDARWATEEAAYLALSQCCYSLPQRATIPDWRAQVAEARERRRRIPPVSRRKRVQAPILAGLIALVALAFWLWRRGDTAQA